MAETTLSESRLVLDSSSGEILCSTTSPSSGLEGPVCDEACKSPQLFEAATTRLSFHDTEPLLRLEDLEQNGTFLSAPSSPTLGSKSATSDNTSPIISEPHFPPSDSDEDDILALNSFSLSLVSDNSSADDDEDDDRFNVSESLDTLLSLPPPAAAVTLQSSKLLPHVSGLGISGLMRKDGSGPFDGLGIVSIESSTWRHLPKRADLSEGFRRRRPTSFSSSSSAYDGSLESEDFLGTNDRISDIFLQETLLTFRVKSHSANDNSQPIVLNPPHRRRTSRLRTHFSSPTISSELKRSSTVNIQQQRQKQNNLLRNRSSSWPSSVTEETAAAATPLPRCRWRL